MALTCLLGGATGWNGRLLRDTPINTLRSSNALRLVPKPAPPNKPTHSALRRTRRKILRAQDPVAITHGNEYPAVKCGAWRLGR
jgi:hypothetical protein